MLNRKLFWISLLVVLVTATQAFVVSPRSATRLAPLQAHNKFMTAITTAAVVVSTSPLIALAEEDYEYGAVDAPIGLAWGAGILAILTALLPVLLKGGEEAFEEMKERDKDTFGSNKADVLKSKKK